MPSVKAYIGGDRQDLDYLIKHLSAAGVAVEGDEVGYLILRREGRKEDVQKKLEESVAVLSGICCLHLDSRAPLRINHYTEIEDDGSQMVYIAVEDEVHARERIDIEVTSDDGVVSFASPRRSTRRYAQARNR